MSKSNLSAAPALKPVAPTKIILKAQEVADYLGVHIATVWRAKKLGTLPAPVKITQGRIGWLLADLNKHLGIDSHNGAANTNTK